MRDELTRNEGLVDEGQDQSCVLFDPLQGPGKEEGTEHPRLTAFARG